MANSFIYRRLRVRLILGGTNSVFAGTGDNTLVLTDMRVSATVKSTARLATNADIHIFGMKADDMNALSVIWANPPIVLDHVVILEEETGADAWAQVFRGTIIEAQPDYDSAPDVPFVITARTGYFQKLNAAPPTSYSGAVSIQTIAIDLAKRMNFTLVDGGAKGSLNSPYFWGTLFDQFAKACEDTNTDFYTLGDQIIITEFGKPRTQQPSVILNKNTGLLGYPRYDRAGLVVRAIHDPVFSCAVPLQIESIVPAATGRWYPYSLTHFLDSRVPRGEWMSVMQCLRVLV